MGYLSLGLFVVVAFALFRSGESLRCWTCSSDMEAACSDYFNTTLYSRLYNRGSLGVELQTCDDRDMYRHNSKAVCMKKKHTNYGRTMYIRSCQFLHNNEKIGTCPDEHTSSSGTVDFCEYCDHDGCNGATSLQTTILLSIIVPFLIMLLLRK